MSDNRRCDECGGELSYCGDMGFDGPRLDCKVCQLRDRIADLEAAARLLGAEVWTMRDNYPNENWAHITKVQDAVNAHPTAAGFVKEAGDGH